MSGLRNLYPNLPGMLVTFKDGGMALKNDVTASKSDSMLILGTAADGPVLEPVAVDDQSVEALFGKSKNANGASNGATLVKAYRQARKRGCNDIRLMRVTGSTAKCEIEGETIVVSEKVRASEAIGFCSGNEETVFTLSNNNVVRDSAKVFVDGEILLSGYVVEETNGVVTINQGVVSAGKSVTISYEFYEEVQVTGEDQVVAGLKVTTASMPKGAVVVTKGGTAIAAGGFTVSGCEITFGEDSGIVDGDVVTLAYITDGEATYSIESGTSQAPFVTGSRQVVAKLKNAPEKDTIILYANGARVPDQSIMTIDLEAREIGFDNKHFELGDEFVVEYLYLVNSDIKQSITLESHFGGSVYNQTKVVVANLLNEGGQAIGKTIEIIKPESKKLSSEGNMVFRSLDYRTLGELADAITKHPLNNICKATTNAEGASTTTLVDADLSFTSGNDGLVQTDQQMFEALSGKRDSKGYLIKPGAYQLLEDYTVDWIVPVGVYMDTILADKEQSFAYELALMCAVLSHRNKTTLGAIAVSPNKDLSLLGTQTYAKKLAKLDNLYFMKDAKGAIVRGENGKPVDLGLYLSVVAGPETIEFETGIGSYYGNPAIDYVAENCTLLPQSAPTNKPVKGAKQLRFTFSNSQLNDITGNRIVTFKHELQRNGENVVLMVDGITAAHSSSDYTRITTPKVLKVAVDGVREVCMPFIGESNDPAKRNAMAAAISKRLSILREKGVIVDSEFQIISTAKDQLEGGATIELSIVAPIELRKITAVVGLKSN